VCLAASITRWLHCGPYPRFRRRSLTRKLGLRNNNLGAVRGRLCNYWSPMHWRTKTQRGRASTT
jgi:hypothetical protein